MMRSILFIALASCWVIAEAADPGACYNISDTDSRNYCLAKAHNDASRCYSIQSNSKRSECLAELK